MTRITFQDFLAVDLRVGVVLEAQPFPEAHKPAYKLRIDFGDEIGVRKSSAQVTDLYNPADLVGKQVLAVVNFPPKRIGPFMSECLVTGFSDAAGRIVLAVPDSEVPIGARLM